MYRFVATDLVVCRTVAEIVELGPACLDADESLIGQGVVHAGQQLKPEQRVGQFRVHGAQGAGGALPPFEPRILIPAVCALRRRDVWGYLQITLVHGLSQEPALVLHLGPCPSGTDADVWRPSGFQGKVVEQVGEILPDAEVRDPFVGRGGLAPFSILAGETRVGRGGDDGIAGRVGFDVHEFQFESEPVSDVARVQASGQAAARVEPGIPFPLGVHDSAGGVIGDRPGWAGCVAVHLDIATCRIASPADDGIQRAGVGQAKIRADIEVGVRGGQNVHAEHEDAQAKWGCVGHFFGCFRVADTRYYRAGWRIP